ncbi:MAG: hypothetical protein NC180_10465 [Muribaculaceae bacterium]|nr:hypothetical protein [Roseburia sp.]MCM1432147.1 hypothetical protein [Muribaculaceae bacterium]MCM1493634.1 hypothetical protein [Muribaculaceae bacterium]MCM1560187.1 hypothetical protein [Butyrivibrio sp.]
MNQYPNAGAGLKKMYIAQIGALICTVCAIIPVINLIAAIAALVFLIISMVGLNGAGKDIAGCKTAFTLTIVNIVLSVVAVFFSAVPVVSTLFSVAENVISFLVVYLVCTSVAAVMTQMNANDVAESGNKVWKINLICYAAAVVIGILGMIPALTTAALILSVVLVIVTVIANIFYLLFLGKSSKVLGA